MTHVEQKLAVLRDRFAASLSRRVDEIRAALAVDPIVLERLFHTLAGSAGTYGFPAVSAIAAQGEEVCEDQLTPWTARRPALETIVDDLHAAVRAVSTEATPLAPPEDEPEPTGEAPAARILCVEDDADQAAYIAAVLRSEHYEVKVAHDAAEFERVRDRFRPDLVLLDVSLPDGSGVDLATAMRRVDAFASIPIIFVTGRGTLQARVEGIRAGGDDYLVKPVDRNLLLASIAARLERSRAMRALLDRDALTQTVTRAAFLQSLEDAVAVHGEKGTPYCLVMFDIDHFKRVNDTYGHLTGDRVLSLFGRFLRGNVRAEDVVGRCGGEEFGALLLGIRAEDARSLIERLLEHFARIPQSARRGERFNVTFSAGVAMLEEDEDAEHWRQRADDALYAAKRAGRARVEAA